MIIYGRECRRTRNEEKVGSKTGYRVRATLPPIRLAINGAIACRHRSHRPSTTSIPSRIASSWLRLTHPAHSVSSARSIAMVCDRLATESLGRRVLRAGSRVLPGACAQLTLLVSGTPTNVARALRLKASD